MIEQIMHFTDSAAFEQVFASAPDDPFPHYIAHTPAKWNQEIECVSVCRADQAVLDGLDADQLGNYTDGLIPGAQDIIDRCYDTTPVELFDDQGNPYDPPEFYNPPAEIGAFA